MKTDTVVNLTDIIEDSDISSSESTAYMTSASSETIDCKEQNQPLNMTVYLDQNSMLYSSSGEVQSIITPIQRVHLTLMQSHTECLCTINVPIRFNLTFKTKPSIIPDV
jgi:hypothetical protein